MFDFFYSIIIFLLKSMAPSGIKKYINNEYKDYGKMLNLKIDSENKSIALDVLLKGEKEKISIKFENYILA